MLDKMKPTFEKGGKLSALRSVFEGFESFLVVPNETSRRVGSQIHDSADSKRLMMTVIIALAPAMLFGMYNVGYQHFLAIGGLQTAGFWEVFGYGFLAVLPKILVTYIVGLGIEFIAAQIKGEEIHEGFLVTGFILPMVVPVDCPLWILAIATAFAVIFAKEIFGGTGYNVFNVALVARAFMFFAYPTKMSGDAVWVRESSVCGIGEGSLVDGFTGATPLGQLGSAQTSNVVLTGVDGSQIGALDAVLGFIPGSIGETSIIAIALGALILICCGVSSWKTTLSIFIGGGLTAFLFNEFGPDTAIATIPWYWHLILGGFAFGAVFMATDPVTSSRTETGKWIYGFCIGVMAILIRVLNPGYPEGMMLAILLMNIFAPLIDYFVVQSNISKRAKRIAKTVTKK